jgi:hypothetical protein
MRGRPEDCWEELEPVIFPRIVGSVTLPRQSTSFNDPSGEAEKEVRVFAWALVPRAGNPEN